VFRPPRRRSYPLGLATKLAVLGIRFDPDTFGMPRRSAEAMFRSVGLTRPKIHPESTWMVENEVTYLSVWVPVDGVASVVT